MKQSFPLVAVRLFDALNKSYDLFFARANSQLKRFKSGRKSVIAPKGQLYAKVQGTKNPRYILKRNETYFPVIFSAVKTV